jgi:hypothetical protein
MKGLCKSVIKGGRCQRLVKRLKIMLKYKDNTQYINDGAWLAKPLMSNSIPWAVYCV